MFGPQQLPKVLREVGRIIGELQRATMQAQSIVREEMWKMEQQANSSATPAAHEPNTSQTEPATPADDNGPSEHHERGSDERKSDTQ